MTEQDAEIEVRYWRRRAAQADADVEALREAVRQLAEVDHPLVCFIRGDEGADADGYDPAVVAAVRRALEGDA